jgi:hypothetical protein
LRAVSGLARVLADGRTERACELLQRELQYFADQPELGDRADARALLRSLKEGSQC